MSNIEPVREIFGEELAKQLEVNQLRAWSIQKALSTEYTRREQAEPKVTIRVAESNESQLILNNAKSSSPIYSDAEAINKLLRYGLSEFVICWGEKILLLNELEAAGTITSNYLPDDDFTVNSLDQKEALPELECTDSSPQRVCKQYSDLAGRISEESGIDLSRVAHLAIILAGKGMCKKGLIPEPRCGSIADKIEMVDSRFDTRLKRQYQIVNGAITGALNTDYQEKVEEELEESCPRVWEKYEEDLNRVDTSSGSVRLWD